MQMSLSLSPSRDDMVAAFLAKDTSYDGQCFVAEQTTGIFCRPSCPHHTDLATVEFFLSLRDAILAGYRPCPHCDPIESLEKFPNGLKKVLNRVETVPDYQPGAMDRHSNQPGTRTDGQLDSVVQCLDTAIGLMVAGAGEQGISRLEFADRSLLEAGQAPHSLVSNPHIATLQMELTAYFAGQLTQFSVPMALQGTSFQVSVWAELRRISHGETIAYDELAQRIGKPTAVRAVARANGQNPMSILIPCHRVIGKDGSLTGYSGGLWRKRLLLELERTGKLPGRL